jgi:hypothetical protein
MPVRSALTRLPEQVRLFLDNFAESGDWKKAAIEAGSHPANARRFYLDTMNHADARAAFDQIIRTRFSHAAPMAMSLLIEMVKNERKEFTGAVRLAAAQDILNRSGYTAKALAQQAEQKDLSEMSRDELLAIINQGESELADRAKLVEHVPIADADVTEVIDLES